MMTIGDQLTHDFRFAQRELEQARHAFAPRRRRIDDMQLKVWVTCRIPCSKPRPRFFVPRIAVAAADRDISRAQPIDRFQRARQFRRERDPLNNIREIRATRSTDSASGSRMNSLRLRARGAPGK